METVDRDALAEENLRLVSYAYSRIAGTVPLADDDLYDVLTFGYARAVMTYDPGKGRFSSYAMLIMRRWVQQQVIHDRRHPFPSLSTDVPVSEAGDLFVSDVIPSRLRTEDAVLNAMLAREIRQSLKPRQWDMLFSWAAGETMEHIASRYGCTRENVRQIVGRVIRKIRKKFPEETICLNSQRLSS